MGQGMYDSLSSADVKAMLHAAMAMANPAGELIDQLALTFDSDKASELHKWLGGIGAMRQWVGGRKAIGLAEYGITINNLKYEKTIEVALDDLRRDKTGMLQNRIDQLAMSANLLDIKKVMELIDDGETGVCYDGQYFFDTDHAEGDSGTQSNDLTVDISALPVTHNGSTTAPSPAEMMHVIHTAVEQIRGFVDDHGEPVNEFASSFVVVAPQPLARAASVAVSKSMLDGGDDNVLMGNGFNLRLFATPRSTWTTKVAVFRTDTPNKPFIIQNELDPTPTAKAEGSDFEHDHDAHQYGIKRVSGFGYGDWKAGCLVTMT